MHTAAARDCTRRYLSSSPSRACESRCPSPTRESLLPCCVLRACWMNGGHKLLPSSPHSRRTGARCCSAQKGVRNTVTRHEGKNERASSSGRTLLCFPMGGLFSCLSGRRAQYGAVGNRECQERRNRVRSFRVSSTTVTLKVGTRKSSSEVTFLIPCFRRSRSWREMPLLLRTSMEKRNMKKMALILTHLAGMAMISGVPAGSAFYMQSAMMLARMALSPSRRYAIPMMPLFQRRVGLLNDR